MRTTIRQAYPVTFTEIASGFQNGTVLTCWLRHNPPVYTSKTGKVHRWDRDAIARRKVQIYAIRGSRATELHIAPVWPRTNMHRLRAYGTRQQMEILLATAIRTWGELPGGREIETLFERMFPIRLELEVTPLVDKAAKP